MNAVLSCVVLNVSRMSRQMLSDVDSRLPSRPKSSPRTLLCCRCRYDAAGLMMLATVTSLSLITLDTKSRNTR
eukprot:4037730-Prymnesium_polylepis.2